ncbi:MAG: SUMF1/EgtB/PvdO family nonheme iron enzyme [Desulfobacterales bacterium]|nr:MAG: SUMF1/EgtB/PvdO family nonheme iron enzyme [Desulfobacterales bacterium]
MNTKILGDAKTQIPSAPLHLRVFLASPGDVADERTLALQVLEQLQYDPLLRGRIILETVAWDKPGASTPMLATLTPQEAIKKSLSTPADCDIVIVIFWSRMGTPLPEGWKKPDGSRYLSGTEWEYLNALEAADKHKKPEILVYRRTEKINLDPDDPDFETKSHQWRLVKQFFESFQNPNGSIKRGYNQYPAPEKFREQLNLHLRSLVREILEREAPIAAVKPASPSPQSNDPPLWRNSPFPGLRAFTPADAPIFFGRGRETDGLVSKLADPAVRFLAIVGASGSGKSSLVAAGLIPRLTAGALPGSKDWVWNRFTPGEVGDNPFMALAVPFKELIQQHGKQPRALAENLANNPAAVADLRDLLLADKPSWAELLLFIDQFEELFTLVAPHYVGPFVELLNEAAQTEHIRAVATLRADFYHRCVEQPPLAELLGSGSYPLAAPGPGALHEMIARPAERAGLIFETGLVERILDQTGNEPGALALLAFALAQLYASRTAEGYLTWTAYEGFGGVQGAIAKRAEDTVHGLGVTPKTIGEVFQELVEVEEGDTVTRRRAPWARLVQSPEAERLVKAFIDVRLLVASRGEDGQAVVEVAHEALFTAWQRLRTWLETHREQLNAGQDLEEAAREWQALGERWAGLASGARLKRYRQAIKPSAQADRFLKASRRRRGILWGTAGLATALVLALAGGTVLLYAKGLTIKHGTSMLLAAVGLYHISDPTMVEIPTGEFWMGSKDDDSEARANEKPSHVVVISKPFGIGKYEVTFEEYDRFAYATKRPLPSDAENQGRDRYPVVNICWIDAMAYAEWLSSQTGKRYRLPTEAEWEYAARAGTNSVRFWGNSSEQACEYANVADLSHNRYKGGRIKHTCDDGHKVSAKVGSFKPNPFGLYDMLGNVWEWVHDCWNDTYKEAPADGSAWPAGQCDDHIARGGSWNCAPEQLRSAHRLKNSSINRSPYIGFRLAQDF